MRTIKLSIQYDGSLFFGFQRQKNVMTIQELIETAIHKLYKRPIKVQYAGRTDRGVHAKCQVVVYNDEGKIPLEPLKQIINKKLGFPLVIDIEETHSTFDPRRDALFREYEYWMYEGKQNIFLDRYLLYVQNIQLDLMQECAESLAGIKDCRNLCTEAKQYKNTKRIINKADLKKTTLDFLGYKKTAYRFAINANSFLQHMVRKTIGLMLEVNNKKLSLEQFKQIVDGKLTYKWPPAPAKALFLSEIGYKGRK
ncbi:MAG: tRNA pseudouridine(38-40) synthase TruA [Candidatus Margulisbacteria bacterium]|nr:tRNA pseudouridine(38-40) synthase TruA [Candidatus Margulisiibacteriota bacterium]